MSITKEVEVEVERRIDGKRQRKGTWRSREGENWKQLCEMECRQGIKSNPLSWKRETTTIEGSRSFNFLVSLSSNQPKIRAFPPWGACLHEMSFQDNSCTFRKSTPILCPIY